MRRLRKGGGRSGRSRDEKHLIAVCDAKAEGGYNDRFPPRADKNPQESARGSKSFRAFVVPGGMFGGGVAIFASENHFPEQNERGRQEAQNPQDSVVLPKAKLPRFKLNFKMRYPAGEVLRPPTCQKYFLDKLKRKAVTMPSPAFCFFAASAAGRLCAAGLIAGNVAAGRFLSCWAQNPFIICISRHLRPRPVAFPFTKRKKTSLLCKRGELLDRTVSTCQWRAKPVCFDH